MVSSSTLKFESSRGRPPTASAGPATSLEVVVVAGPDTGRRASLAAGSDLVMGTGGSARLVLRSSQVAVEHARLTATPAGVELSTCRDDAEVWVGALRVYRAVLPARGRFRMGDATLELRAEVPDDSLRAQLAAEGVVYASSAMESVARALAEVAPHTTTVLVTGETGTGKEAVARALHRLSLRRNGPFVVVDCGALPSSMIESELFGFEKGAFTGAERRRLGAFERAHGGTVFLDEIGELPLDQQASFLGVLQRKRFTRVGGHDEVAPDVRIVAATNRDLAAEVRRGTFRRDLYYRLATLPLALPPLRERREDVAVLVEHFARELTGHPLLDEPAVIHAATADLPFEGNVRELQALVERRVVRGSWGEAKPAHGSAGEIAPVSPSTLEPSLPPPAFDGSTPYVEARRLALDAFEKRFLEHLMAMVDGNASKASRLAHMDRPNLLRLLTKHGLRRARTTEPE
jgi:transcriptional regulator with GAF, ATPase, and Fis domain